MKSIIAFLALLCYGAMAVADEETEAAAQYSKGANQCMSCHREGRDKEAHEVFLTPMGISGAADSPFADGNHDCEACHGPSATHRKKQKDGTRLLPAVTFNRKTPVETQNQICMTKYLVL